MEEQKRQGTVSQRFKRVKTRDLVLGFLRHFIDRQGYSPSLREIAEAIDITPPVVRYHLIKLAESGRLTFRPGRTRTISLQQDGGGDQEGETHA